MKLKFARCKHEQNLNDLTRTFRSAYTYIYMAPVPETKSSMGTALRSACVINEKRP